MNAHTQLQMENSRIDEFVRSNNTVVNIELSSKPQTFLLVYHSFQYEFFCLFLSLRSLPLFYTNTITHNDNTEDHMRTTEREKRPKAKK